jgi:hypothetical protein
MNTNDFFKYIENPDLLNAATVAEMQDVLKSFPYFQTAHFLYLKSLYNQNNFKFNEALKFSSVHVNNRKHLLYFLKDKLQVLPIDYVNDEVPILDEVEIDSIIETSAVIETSPEPIVENDSLVTADQNAYVQEEIPVNDSDTFTLSIEEVSVEEHEPIVDSKTVDGIEAEELILSTEVEDFEESQIWPVEEELLETDLVVPVTDEEASELKVDELLDEESSQIEETEVPPVEDKKQSLSPQEIIAKRITEINQQKEIIGEEIASYESEELVDKEDSEVEDLLEPKEDIVAHSAPELKEIKAEIPTRVPSILVRSFSNETTVDKEEVLVETDDDLMDLSELIQVAAPSEYFLEDNVLDELEPITKSDEDQIEKRSFEDWLNRFSAPKTSKKTIKKAHPKVKPEVSKLIDQFLSDKSSKLIKVKPSESIHKKELKAARAEEPENGFMTETLANIYIKQGYYEKAIEAYTKLSLKYPKKNSYFANQIKKVKELQLNS